MQHPTCFTTSALLLSAMLLTGASCQAPEESKESLKPAPNWPPRIILNTDGNWAFNYLTNRDPKDLTVILDALKGSAIDIVTVLVGIDDDLSWRGSPHGQLWGDNIENWNPDEDSSTPSVGGMSMSDVERLHANLAAVVDDGHDLMKIYIDRARELELGMFASFRMNDVHVNLEDRGWYGRSAQKLERTDLLMGHPVWSGDTHAVKWGFSWRWDYAEEEVRQRFLGLMDETLTRYDFDGLELDFGRSPPLFQIGERFKNIPTLTEFMRKAQGIVRRHESEKGREIKLIARVPVSIDAGLEMGFDIETWIREGLMDAVILGSPSYAMQRIDIERAVKAAEQSKVLVYTGFDSSTHAVSPQGGYERNPITVLRASALNGYKQGAAGVHLFNYGYRGHRQRPVPEGTEMVAKPVGTDLRGYFTPSDLQDMKNLGDAKALEKLDRCYHAETRAMNTAGDYPAQVPMMLSLVGRGAGPAHAIEIRVDDDISAGLAEGRIKKTELRLRLTHTQKSFDRIRCEVNGTRVDLASAGKIQNSRGHEWLVLDNPPVKNGINTILLVLEGIRTPAEHAKRRDPWPTLESCEIIVKAGS